MAQTTIDKNMNGTAGKNLNGGDKQTFVYRVINIPIVHEGLTNFQMVLQSNAYSAAAFDKATLAATNVYKATEPIQVRLGPQIEAIDSFANKGLDYVQTKFPYAFEASSGEMYSRARKPADEAAAAAKAKISPFAEQMQHQLQMASTNLHSVQDRLAQTIASLPRSSQEASAAVKEAAHSVLAEVERIRDLVSNQAKDLPSQIQNTYSSLSDSLVKGAADIKAELSKSDVSLSSKANKVLAISTDTLMALKDSITAKKSVPEEKIPNGQDHH